MQIEDSSGAHTPRAPCTPWASWASWASSVSLDLFRVVGSTARQKGHNSICFLHCMHNVCPHGNFTISYISSKHILHTVSDEV